MMQRLATISFALLLAFPALGFADGPEEHAYRQLLAARSDAIVTVKAVLKSEMRMMGQAQDEESRTEVVGVVVDPSGLVLVSNSPFSATRMRQMMSGLGMPPGFEIEITPVDLKVLFAGDETEYDAFIVATDGELDLAFLQVEGLGDRKLPVVAFEAGAGLEIGQEVFAVTRLGRSFDYAPHVKVARVSGEIRRPRRAWILDSQIEALGLPVFSADGRALAVFTSIAGAAVEESPSAMGGPGAMMRMLRPGGPMSDAFAYLAIPSSAVGALLGSARQRAQEMRQEREQAEPSAAASPESGDG